MTQKELFELCTGITLPWHIHASMITVLTNRGKLILTFPNHIEIIYNKDTLMTYLNSSVFECLRSSNGLLSFEYSVLEQHREIFKNWKLPLCECVESGCTISKFYNKTHSFICSKCDKEVPWTKQTVMPLSSAGRASDC